QLENLYAGTQKPEVRTAVLEWGFARMGPAGEELLIKEAASASDPSCRIAAWSLLNKTGAIERKADLQAGARQFLQAWNPPETGVVSAAGRVQARYYVELFAAIYLRSGTSEDLPFLKRMADKPALPGADARLLEILGRSAAAAVEMIELRARLN
ncbi:MAG TPA: hypothetical protein VFS19_01005, partial [Planctomycetota bacterium]|nr:hypothetical protein [Planctomycetota bacterium]